MKKRLLPLVWLLATALAQSQVSERDSLLSAAQKLYNDGQYVQAELEARRLAESIPAEDTARIGPEKLIAFSLVALGRSASARDHFLAILKVDPMFDLDPLLTSPKILAAYLDAKSSLSMSQHPAGNQLTSRSDSPMTSPTFRTIVFPGWEQLYQGRTTSGYVFAGSGVVTLGTGIALDFLRASARKDYLAARASADIQSSYDTYNRYYKTEKYFFIAFGLVYLASEIDVFTPHSPVDVQLQSSVFPAEQTRLALTVRF